MRYLNACLLRCMALSLLLGLQSTTALAVCNDQQQRTVKDELLLSKAVVSANVIYSLDLQEDATEPARVTATLYTFKITDTFKGNPPSLLRVRSENISPRFPMDMGRNYLLFLNPDTAHHPRDYVVDQCGNSGLAEEKQSAIARIRQLKADKGNTCIEQNPWRCYGALEVEVSMVHPEGGLNSEKKILSMLDLRFEDEISMSQMQMVLEDAQPYERVLKSFIQIPHVQTSLYKNGSSAEFRSMGTDALGLLEVAVAAFPQGPVALGRREQTAIAEIKSYHYPVGNKIDKIRVKVKKAANGNIDIEYTRFGEPIGLYIVRAKWHRNLLKPLPDDYSLQDWRGENGEKFTSLKEARLSGSKN